VEPRILVVDDEPREAELVTYALRRRGHTADHVSSAEECLARMQHAPAELALVDMMMPGMSGVELCHALREQYPETVAIMLTGRGDVGVAVDAMHAGVYDFLTKPLMPSVLELSIGRALAFMSLREQVMSVRECVTADTPEPMSGAFRKTLALAHQIAPSDVTVLITGESGTGKERVARAIHAHSPRRVAPFVAVNCSAMPLALLESELFGHARGSFTGAEQDRIGLFLHAGEGTLLLDEIGEMPLEMQAKLLRVLQQRTVRPVGGDTEVQVRARILAATSRDLEAEIAAGTFREDLYHRINVVSIEVPPLRERLEDVLLLAQVMLRRTAIRLGKPVRGLTPAAAQSILEYSWPGNVRELENCIEAAVTLCRLDEITVADLPPPLQRRGAFGAAGESHTAGLLPLLEMKRRYVRTVLAMSGGNKSLTGRLLDVDRRTITHLLKTSDGPGIADAGNDENEAR
jgi:two-component system, NtrC family, response regulator AtoC